MNEKYPGDRVSGWALAGALFIHLLILGDSSVLVMATYLLLGVGALLRGRQIFAPTWLERGLFFLSVAAVFFNRQGNEREFVMGEMGGLAGAVFLLRPVTPARGLRVVFCVLAVLAASMFRPYPGVGAVFIVLDVVVLMILTQQIHRPPEAAQSFWASLVRSLRVVVPVSIVVILVFALFPDYSLQTMPAITGFAGGDTLNPGGVSNLSQSRRVALVAKFSGDQNLPHASQLYWRGQVLERNQGLLWSRDPSRKAPGKSLQSPPPAAGVPVWHYVQEVASNRGGILPVLDRTHQIEATRGGLEIVVLDFGASVLGPVGSVGTGGLRLDITAAGDSVSDPPDELISEGALNVPRDIQGNAELRAIADQVIPRGSGTEEALAGVAAYLQNNNFQYTLKPGRGIFNLATFLLKVRRGFCEHYAAAAANLLRLGGIPARIVVGYRGGEWNPWLHSITVRDLNAHAWVEAWDARSNRWIRFDPTNYVAPDLTARMERDMNSETWPWYRIAESFVVAFFSSIGDRIAGVLEAAGSSEIWESLQPVFFVGLLLSLSAWLVRRIILRQRQKSRDIAASLLADLESRANALGRARREGETPLAWLDRLRAGADGKEESHLRAFAGAYENGVYAATGLTAPTIADLRGSARQLKRIWKTRRRRVV